MERRCLPAPCVSIFRGWSGAACPRRAFRVDPCLIYPKRTARASSAAPSTALLLVLFIGNPARPGRFFRGEAEFTRNGLRFFACPFRRLLFFLFFLYMSLLVGFRELFRVVGTP